MADSMVKQNRGLLNIPGSQKMKPLYLAALYGNHEMVKYLYDNSNKMYGDSWMPLKRGWFVLKCIEAKLFDIALKMLNENMDILDYQKVRKNGQKELPISYDILKVLAQKPEAFKETKPRQMWNTINPIIHLKKVGSVDAESQALQLLRIVWKNVIKKPTTEIDDIPRGPVDKEDDRTAEKEGPVMQLLRLAWENVVKDHWSEIDKIIKGCNDQVNEDESRGSGGRESEAHQLTKIVKENICKPIK